MKHVLFFLFFSFFISPLFAAGDSYSLQCARHVGTTLGFITMQIWNFGKCCTRPAAERFRAVHLQSHSDTDLLNEQTKNFHETRTAQCTGFCTLACCACAAGECAACCCGPVARLPFHIAVAASCVRAGQTTCYCKKDN